MLLSLSFSTSIPTKLPFPRRHLRHIPRATPFRPSTPPPSGELYQPFRPPPSALTPSLSPTDRLDLLRNRLGLWFDYAPHIAALVNDGLTPPSIEEATGISSVDQNRIIVSSKVRDSLLGSLDAPSLAFFDVGGAELLYEIRLLGTRQRAAASRRIVERKLDPKGAAGLAKAVKDFPRRRGDPGWEFFSGEAPGDCVAYSLFRKSREVMSPSERKAALEQALEEVDTEAARKRIVEELEGKVEKKDEEDESAAKVTVPVVRLKYGEVAETTSVAMMPVCTVEEGVETFAAAPRCEVEGMLGVVRSDKEWKKWVVLPGWEPVMAISGGAAVALAFRDEAVLPWKTARSKASEEAMVVVDRDRKEVGVDDGLYLVGGGDNNNVLKVERGKKLRESEVDKVLGTVVLVVRPPTNEDDMQLLDEDWD